MIKKHPFTPFVPENSRILILGSFPGKESTQSKIDDDWFYYAKRNQFWKIFEAVFNKDLSSKVSKQELFKSQKIAITDIIESCERRDNKNSDENLINRKYNKAAIAEIISQNPITKILFTSKHVYHEFLVSFDKPENIELIVLPSPSPIFRRLNIQDKIAFYKAHLLMP